MKDKGLIFEVSKATHIGEMWQAWREDDKCIQYRDGDNVCTRVDLHNGGNDLTLADHPERFSITKEPRVLWTNVIQDMGEPYTSSFVSEDESLNHDYGRDTKVFLRGHPIEFPEDV